MTREDRNRSIQASDGNQGRRPGEAGGRFRDTSASDRVGGAVELMDPRDEVVGSQSGESSTGDGDDSSRANSGVPEIQREQSGAMDGHPPDAARLDDGTRDGGDTTELLEWVPPPNIVPEGQRSDR